VDELVLGLGGNDMYFFSLRTVCIKYLLIYLIIIPSSRLLLSVDKEESIGKHISSDIEVWLGFLNTFYINTNIIDSLADSRRNTETVESVVSAVAHEFKTRIDEIKKRKKPLLLVADPRLFKDKYEKETANIIDLRSALKKRLREEIPNLNVKFFDDMNNIELLKIISSNKKKLYIDNRVEYYPGQAQLQLPETLKSSLEKRNKSKYCMRVSRFSTNGVFIKNMKHFKQARELIECCSHAYTNFDKWNLNNPNYQIQTNEKLTAILGKEQLPVSRTRILFNIIKDKIRILCCSCKKSTVVPS
jgi:hypothetical protein